MPESESPTQIKPRALTEEQQIPTKTSGVPSRLGWRRRTMTALTLATAATMGGSSLPPTSHGQEGNLDFSTPIVTPRPSEVPPASETPELTLEQKIENEYGIELITQKDVSDFLGVEIEEHEGQKAQSNWTNEELLIIDEMFSYLPPSLIQPIDEVDLKLFPGSFDTNCSCAGVYLGKGVIGIQEDVIDLVDPTDPRHSDYRDTLFSVLVHEVTHRRHFLTNFAIDHKLRGIVGRDSRLIEEKINSNIDKFPLTYGGSMAEEAFRSFAEEGGHRNHLEGVAEISEIYILGYEEFMKSIGPFLDSDSFSSEDLSLKYPKTQELYDLYKGEIFGGLEYDDLLRQYIEYGKSSSSEKLKQEIDKNVNFINSSEAPISFEEYLIINNLLKAFPDYFYSPIDGNKLNIVISDEEIPQRNDGRTIFLSRHSLSTVNEETYLLEAVAPFAHGLIIRANEFKGYRPEEKVIESLGGKKFLTRPEELFPRLFTPSKSPGVEEVRQRLFTPEGNFVGPTELVTILGELYVEGPRGGFRSLEQLLDPPGHFKNIDSVKDYEKRLGSSNYYKLYKLIGKIFFDGKEYLEFLKGVPVFQEKDGE